MDLGLTDKIIIVTGGAKGIGAAAVRSFAAEGAKVVITGRSPAEGIALAQETNGLQSLRQEKRQFRPRLGMPTLALLSVTLPQL